MSIESATFYLFVFMGAVVLLVFTIRVFKGPLDFLNCLGHAVSRSPTGGLSLSPEEKADQWRGIKFLLVSAAVAMSLFVVHAVVFG